MNCPRCKKEVIELSIKKENVDIQGTAWAIVHESCGTTIDHIESSEMKSRNWLVD